VGRDPDDRKFLVLAYASRADALVTGDHDLLALAATSRIPIQTPEALHKRLFAGLIVQASVYEKRPYSSQTSM